MTLFPCKLAYSALLGLDSTFPKLDKNVAKKISHATQQYTSLKGPDIVLCEEPKFSLRKTSRDIFDQFISHELFSEAHLLFLNNGTVSGVLRLEAHFEPTIVKESCVKNHDAFVSSTSTSDLRGDIASVSASPGLLQ
jgi:hypothetical protein